MVMTFDLTTKMTGLLPNDIIGVRVVGSNLYTEIGRAILNINTCMTGE